MAKILSYRMTHDSGFAPNPFGGVLTLATCTPNHMRARLESGDWIVGIEANVLRDKRKSSLYPIKNNFIVYVAKVDKILSLNEYSNDSQFEGKKHANDKGWKETRGDNVYCIENNEWRWTRGHEHDSNKFKYFSKGKLPSYKPLSQDIKGDRVFICKEFSYFGDFGVEFDINFLDCIKKTCGFKYCRNNDDKYEKFLSYIKSLMTKYGKGKIGNPILCAIGERNCQDKIKQKISC